MTITPQGYSELRPREAISSSSTKPGSPSRPPTSLDYAAPLSRAIPASRGTRPHLCRSRGPRRVHHLRPYRIQVHRRQRAQKVVRIEYARIEPALPQSPPVQPARQILGILSGAANGSPQHPPKSGIVGRARFTRTRIIPELGSRRLQPCLRDWQRAPELRDSPPEFPDYSQGCPAGDGI